MKVDEEHLFWGIARGVLFFNGYTAFNNFYFTLTLYFLHVFEQRFI